MNQITSIQPKKVLLVIALSMIGVFFAWLISLVLPTGIDWKLTYRPATRVLLSGANPYVQQFDLTAPFVAAPWTLIPLIPFALLPERLGSAAIFMVSIIIFAYSVHKLGGKIFSVILFILSPPVIHCLLNSNMEWLPIFGFVLPPQIGLFFISTKPQTGFAVAIFWLYLAWRTGGYREVIRVFSPFTIVLLVSLIIFGSWPLTSYTVVGIAEGFNASLWPASFPIGIAFLFISLTKLKKEFAMAASPFLSPYALFHSYSGAIAALVTNPITLLATDISLWILVIYRFFEFR